MDAQTALIVATLIKFSYLMLIAFVLGWGVWQCFHYAHEPTCLCEKCRLAYTTKVDKAYQEKYAKQMRQEFESEVVKLAREEYEKRYGPIQTKETPKSSPSDRDAWLAYHQRRLGERQCS